MELRIFNSLRKLNRRFYDVYAESFSSTRHSIWPGWLRVADVLDSRVKSEMSVLDIAAGNGRFEAFLADRFPDVIWDAVCVDPCDDLMSKAQGKLTSIGFGNMSCKPLILDVLDLLISDMCEADDQLIVPERFDLITCFGFMHHVYGMTARESLIRLMSSQGKQGSMVAVSFWRFASDDAFLQKAEEQTQAALDSMSAKSLLGASALKYREAGDYLLGWQGNVEVPRYCHSFTQEEVSQLIESVSDRMEMIDRFSADGRTGAMNEYVIFRVL